MNKLEEAIKRLERATYQRPDNCKNCKYCITEPTYRFEDRNYFCGLIEDCFEGCVNYEVYNNKEPLNCPLPEGETQEDLLQLLGWLKELQELRKQKEAQL